MCLVLLLPGEVKKSCVHLVIYWCSLEVLNAHKETPLSVLLLPLLACVCDSVPKLPSDF